MATTIPITICKRAIPTIPNPIATSVEVAGVPCARWLDRVGSHGRYDERADEGGEPEDLDRGQEREETEDGAWERPHSANGTNSGDDREAKTVGVSVASNFGARRFAATLARPAHEGRSRPSSRRKIFQSAAFQSCPSAGSPSRVPSKRSNVAARRTGHVGKEESACFHEPSTSRLRGLRQAEMAPQARRRFLLVDGPLEEPGARAHPERHPGLRRSPRAERPRFTASDAGCRRS